MLKNTPELIKVYSHPRSGTHMMMNLLGRNFYPTRDLSWLETEWGHWSDRHKDKIRNPYARLFGSHDFVDEVQYAGPKVYVYRDGRAVALSVWKFLGSEQPFPKFLRTKLDWSGTPGRRATPTKTIAEHWYDHVSGWLNKMPPRTVFVRYEDLLADPATQLQRVSYEFNLHISKHVDVDERVGILPGDDPFVWKKQFTTADLDYFHTVVPEDSYYLL